MTRKLLALPVICAVAALPLAVTARAGSYEHFQSPSANIVCAMIAFDIKAYAASPARMPAPVTSSEYRVSHTSCTD
jgi:hypothetical protein